MDLSGSINALMRGKTLPRFGAKRRFGRRVAGWSRVTSYAYWHASDGRVKKRERARKQVSKCSSKPTGCPAVDRTTLIAHISVMPGPIIKPFDIMKVKTGRIVLVYDKSSYWLF